MSIMIPRWGFGQTSSNNNGLGASPGLAFTCGTSGSKGTTVAFLSGGTYTTHIYYVVVAIAMGNAAGPNLHNTMVDIMIDRAGGTSWSVLIPDLQCGYTAVGVQGQIWCNSRYQFPLFIPAGSSVGVRGASESGTAFGGQAVLFAYAAPSRGDMWWYGHGVEAMGANHSATCRGVVVTPGASNAFGTAVRIDNTTGTMRAFGSLQLGTAGFSAASGEADAKGYILRIKRSSTQVWDGLPYQFRAFSTSETGQCDGMFGPNWVDAKATDEIYVDAACNTTSPQNLNVVVYGVY